MDSISIPQLHLIPFVLHKPVTMQELTAKWLSMYAFVVAGVFQALLTLGRKSQGKPLARSLITLTSVSPAVGITPLGRFKTGSWYWLSLSCSLRVDSGHMTKGRSNNILQGSEDDLPHCHATPLGCCCSLGVDLHPFLTTWQFSWDASESLF